MRGDGSFLGMQAVTATMRATAATRYRRLVGRDIAPPHVYLASEESAYVNGGKIAIDGGVTSTHALGG